MASDRVEHYRNAIRSTAGGWIVGVLFAVSFGWFLATSDNLVVQLMLGFVAVLALGYAFNRTRNRATVRRIRDPRES